MIFAPGTERGGKGKMPYFYVLAGIATLFIVLAAQAKRHGRKKRRNFFRENHALWGELATIFFDQDSSSAEDRVQLVLQTIARRLGLRGGMIALHGRDHCRILALFSSAPELASGLDPGRIVARRSLYCGVLQSQGDSLAIDYASLSEWRRHPALFARGWESFLAVNCGLEQGQDVILSFFDSSPRANVFSHAEITLVEQLAPWIMAHLNLSSLSSGSIAERISTGSAPVS